MIKLGILFRPIFLFLMSKKKTLVKELSCLKVQSTNNLPADIRYITSFKMFKQTLLSYFTLDCTCYFWRWYCFLYILFGLCCDRIHWSVYSVLCFVSYLLLVILVFLMCFNVVLFFYFIFFLQLMFVFCCLVLFMDVMLICVLLFFCYYVVIVIHCGTLSKTRWYISRG